MNQATIQNYSVTLSAIAAVLVFFFGCTPSARAETKTDGLGVEPAGVSTVTDGVAAANEKFMIELSLSRNQPKSKATDGVFQYTIDREKFVGEPIVALIKDDKDTDRVQYLVILHYNIPPVRTSLFPVQYGFARLGVRFLGFDKGDKQANKVDLLAIYPTNELLDIEHTDKGTTSLTVQPQYMGTSAGSMQYQKERTDVYNFQLPKVVGTANRYGEAAWTYYPAKQQPLILGSKTAFAVVSLPHSRTRLRLQLSLDYQLKRFKLVPFPLQTLQDSLDFTLSDSKSIHDLLATHGADLPDNVREKIKSSFVNTHQFLFNSGADKSDYILDVTTGNYYRIDTGGVHQIALPN